MGVRIVGCYTNQQTGDFLEPAGWTPPHLQSSLQVAEWVAAHLNAVIFGWMPELDGVSVSSDHSAPAEVQQQQLANRVIENVRRIANHLAKNPSPHWMWKLCNQDRYEQWTRQLGLDLSGCTNSRVNSTTRKKTRAPQFECDWQQLSPDGSLLLRNAPIVDGDELMKAIRDASKGIGGVM